MKITQYNSQRDEPPTTLHALIVLLLHADNMLQKLLEAVDCVIVEVDRRQLSARMSSFMPYRKAADVLAKFRPIPSTESFMTLRYRTMKLGEGLDEKARDRAWFEPTSSSEHKQTELEPFKIAYVI